MSCQPPPLLALPTDLHDETVAQLTELLYEIARVLENHYADQLHRYYQPRDQTQCDLFDEPDPPF